MLRVLHIARSTTRGANAKAAAMARQPDMAFWLVRPLDAAADYLGRLAPLGGLKNVHCWLRRDPHRGLYRTLGFGMRAASPHIIHVEEEPDSLAALQVAMTRRIVAPSARLVLHTWQNVDRPKGPHVKTVLAVTLRAADAVLCASDAAVRVLRAQGFAGLAPVILPGGFDPETFHPRRARPFAAAKTPAFPYDRGSFTVGYVGRLAREKGLDTLVSAVARLGPPVTLEIAGTGRLEAALARQARAEDLGEYRIRFLGHLDADAVADFLNRIDVLVLPSRTTRVWAEQFGRVLVEAMACGTPVVGSSSGEIPAVIGNAGLVFPEGDAVALAERLFMLRRSPELRAGLSERGLKRAVGLYSATRIAEQTAAFYRELAPPFAGASR